MPDEKVERLKGLSLTADGKGAVFDVPAEDVDLFIAGIFFIEFAMHINFCMIKSPSSFYLLLE